MEEETIVSPDPDPEVTTQNPLPLDTPNDAEMSNIQDGDGDILEPKSTFLQLAEDENDTIMKIDESPLPEKHMETEDDILNKFELNDASVADTILEKLEDTLLDEDMESDQLNGTVESPTVEVPILQNGLEETPHNDLVNVTEDPVISEGDKSKEEEDADLLKNQIMDTEDLLQIIPDSPVSHDIVEDEQVDEGDADTQPDSTDINEEATDDPYEDLDSENITLDEDDQIIKDPVENAVISDIEFNGETVMPNKNSFDKLDDLVGEKPPSLGDVFEKIEDLESQSHKLDTQMSVDSLTQHSVDLDGDEADEEDVTKTSKRTLTGTQLDKDSKKAKLDTVDKTGTSDQLSETDASDQVSEAGVPDPVSETEANDQDSEEAPTKKYKHLNLFSDFMRRKRIKTLTRADLEEFCLQKVCEAIYHVSEIGDLRHQLGVQEQMVEMWRKEVTQLAKQARDLEIVNKRLLHEVRQKYGTNKPIVPVKITRSVGLQVRCDNVLSVMAPRKPNKPPPNTVQPIAPKPATIPSTPTSKPPALATIKSAKVLTPKANALLSRALANSTVSSPTNSNPITTTAKSPFRAATSTPLRVIPVKQANAKIPSPKVTSVLTPTHATTSADKNYIDLTDDDDKKPLAVATPVKTVPSTAGVRIVKTSSASVVPSTTGANGPRIMYVYNNQLHQGVLAADPNKPGTQKLMLKLNSNMLDNAVASPDEIDSEPEEPYSDSGSSYAPSEGDISSTSSVSNATNGEKDLLDFDDDAIAIQNKEIASSSNISDTVETQTFKKNEKTSILNTQPSDDNLPINVSSVSNTKDCKTSHSKERENDVFINASVKINGKRGRDKMHACFFCNEVSCSNFARHIEVKHSNELQVAQILGMPKKSKQRRDAFATLLRSGDFFHNCNVLSLNSGELILTRRPTEFEIQNLTFSDFGPCPECLGFMLKRHIWHHRKYNCTEKVSNEKECSVNNDAGLKGSSAESTALLNGILRKEYSPQFTQHILNKLRDDEISNTCKRDDTILRFGAFLYEKYSTTQSDLIRQSMRQLGRFKLELQKQGETFKNISEILVPEKFDAIVNATKSMCVSTTQDITKRPEFKIPSLAIKLGFSIKKCAAIERGQALRMGDLNKSKQCLSFLHLVNLEWSVKISSNAIATLYSRRNNASDLLPVTSDLVKLSNFLDEELKQIVKDVTAQNYSKLLSIVLSGIILFNKRRSGEITRMTLHQYSSKPDLEHSGTEEMKNSLTPFENKLASSLTIVSIMGKRGRIVPILLTKGMIMSIDLLVVNRVKGNISSENPYIFAIPNTRMSHVKGHDCLKKWCAVAELESPELITSPRLRNYISTACQVLNLTENEYNWLAQHLGRDIRADRDFYWLQENAAELTKVSRLLLAVDQGEASKFSGKALTDMHIEGQTNGVLTTVPSSSLSVSNTSLRPGQPVRLAPAPASAVRNTVAIAKQVARHPAPLPTPPLSQLSKAARKPIPPRPHLSIRRSTGGIVLSWKMPYNLDNYESIASYQLYAYQETSAPPSSEMWRKVGDVKALALPMACTLTQFADGNKYHFAVRAVDVLNRMGQFSEPEQILFSINLSNYGIVTETLVIVLSNIFQKHCKPAPVEGWTYLPDRDISLEDKEPSSADLKELIPSSVGTRKTIKKRIVQLNGQDRIILNRTLMEGNLSDCPSPSTSSATNSNDFDVTPGESTSISVDFIEFFTEVQTFPDFDLQNLLQTSPNGNSVLNYYKTNNTLDNKRRSRLVDIIAKHLYAYIIKNRLRHEEYNKITDKIVTLFSTETMGVYYVPTIKKNQSVTGRSIAARGKLVDKVKNLVFNCEEAVPKRQPRKITNANKDCPSTSSVNLKDINESLDVRNNAEYLWLQLNNEPWSEVLQKWENTFYLRHHNNEKYKTVEEYLNIWPSLKDHRSEILINCDFRKLFPGKELHLYTRWKNFFNVVNDLRGTREEISDTDSQDIIFLKQLVSLPHLIPPKGRIVTKLDKGQRHWKYSTLDAVDSMIVLAEMPDDINIIIERQKSLALSRDLPQQPYILVEGASFDHPNNIYIILDNVFVPLHSAQKAFDTLFKVFHVMNTKYPCQSEYIYTLIQRCVYDITLKCDNLPPYVLDIVTKIETETIVL